MSDHSELKLRAEELIDLDLAAPCGSKRVMLINPETVLALIAENERLSTACTRAAQVINAESKAVAIATGRANLLQAERYQLKAENEALRLALESCSDELEGQVVQCYHGQPVEDMHPVTRRAYDRDMLCVTEARAAMGKGEQP